MDRLRALEYFVTAAEIGSFSAAARALGVSLAAVAKLVTALEKDLGTVLFDRNSRGLELTVDGHVYLAACRPALEQIVSAGELVRFAKGRPRGTVVVGAPPQLIRNCLIPALPELHARYPEIEIELRQIGRLTEAAAQGVEVFVLLGWQEPHDLVTRRLATPRSMICGSPSYWEKHGVPEVPRDLERHIAFPYRNPDGVLLDHWRFSKKDQTQEVTVHGWLSGNVRDSLLDAVLAGAGVMRLPDVSILDLLAEGRLVPVLTDWDVLDTPPINLLYRQNHRRIPRLRTFVDFVIEVFSNLQTTADGGEMRARPDAAPRWYRRSAVRASTMFGRSR